jgi:hypothetical protein
MNLIIERNHLEDLSGALGDILERHLYPRTYATDLATVVALARSRMTEIGRVRVNKRRKTLQKRPQLWQIGGMEKQKTGMKNWCFGNTFFYSLVRRL